MPRSKKAPDTIYSFSGRYRFLSNFTSAAILYEKIWYPTVEHAFQAAKSTDKDVRRVISQAYSPHEAKKLGHSCVLREGWDDMKEDVMLDLLRLKFQDDELAQMLLETEDAKLVEGNSHGDTYWGICQGQGLNRLGELLMQVRNELRIERLLA